MPGRPVSPSPVPLTLRAAAATWSRDPAVPRAALLHPARARPPGTSRDLRRPSPAARPGTHAQRRNPCRPRPPPHLRPPPPQRSVLAGGARAERRGAAQPAEPRPLQQWSPGAGPPPPPPQPGSGSGSGSRSREQPPARGCGRTRARRRRICPARAPPLRPRRRPALRGPPPGQWGGSCAEGRGWEKQREVGRGCRGGAAGPAGKRDRGAAPSAAQSRPVPEAARNVRLGSAQRAVLIPNPELEFVGLACCTERETEAQEASPIVPFLRSSFILPTVTAAGMCVRSGAEANAALPEGASSSRTLEFTLTRGKGAWSQAVTLRASKLLWFCYSPPEMPSFLHLSPPYIQAPPIIFKTSVLLTFDLSASCDPTLGFLYLTSCSWGVSRIATSLRDLTG